MKKFKIISSDFYENYEDTATTAIVVTIELENGEFITLLEWLKKDFHDNYILEDIDSHLRINLDDDVKKVFAEEDDDDELDAYERCRNFLEEQLEKYND